MKLIQIERSGGNLVQGFIRAAWPQENSYAPSPGLIAWSRYFLRSVALWSQLKPLSVALRLSMTPGQSPVALYSFVVPAENEARLRMLLAAFLRTDRMAGAVTETLHDLSDLKGGFFHPDDLRIGLDYEELTTGQGHAIVQDVRLDDVLGDIVSAAATLGLGFTYDVQIAAVPPPREIVKSVLYGVAHLKDAQGIPAGLATAQAALAERLKTASFQIEECLGCADPHTLDAVGRLAAEALARTVYGTFAAEPKLRPLSAEDAAPFAYHVHTQVLDDTPTAVTRQACATIVGPAEIDRILACDALGLRNVAGSGGAPSALIEPVLAGMVARGPVATAGTAPVANGRPFLFVSYAHNDSSVVFPVVDETVAAGHAVWIDKRIMGGDDWIAELEARLLQCAGVIAFLSPHFTESRYCRREIQFADAIGKPIIPVQVAPSDMTGGLRFILQPLQYIALHEGGPFQARLSAAIHQQVPMLTATVH